MATIDSFKGKYRFLSNFYIEPDGTHVEGEYQASKCPSESFRFIGLSPHQAKMLGRQVKLRGDWADCRIQIMYDLVHSKFSTHAELRRQLLDTGDAELIEGNTWGDRFWGVSGGSGLNMLGHILMAVRSSLQR